MIIFLPKLVPSKTVQNKQINKTKPTSQKTKTNQPIKQKQKQNPQQNKQKNGSCQKWDMIGSPREWLCPAATASQNAHGFRLVCSLMQKSWNIWVNKDYWSVDLRITKFCREN